MVKVIRFTAPWCRPCEVFGPALERALEHTGVNIEVVDIDDDPDSIHVYDIKSVPTTLILENGGEVNRFVGAGITAPIARAVEALTT